MISVVLEGFMAKILADDLSKLYIWQIAKYGVIIEEAFNARIYYKDAIVEISFPNSRLVQNIDLTTTFCHLGGERTWFQCTYCEKRIGVLYMTDEGYFSCRVCLNLTYKSKNKNYRSKDYDLLRRADNYIKANDLLDQTKRYSYAGQPTKKMIKVDKLYANSIF